MHAPKPDASAAWGEAMKRFPGIRPRRALAVGCGGELSRFFKEDVGLSPKDTYRVMRWWFGSIQYLRACTEGATRYALDGSADGAVTAEQAAHAAEQLAAVEKIRATMKAKKRDAAKQKKRTPKVATAIVEPRRIAKYIEAPRERFNPATGRKILSLRWNAG